MIAQDAFGGMNDQVLESVGGVRVIRAYVQETSDEARFRDITQDVYNKNLAVAKVDALFDPTIRLFIGLSYVIGLGYGAYLIIHNELSSGTARVQYVPWHDDLADVRHRQPH